MSICLSGSAADLLRTAPRGTPGALDGSEILSGVKGLHGDARIIALDMAENVDCILGIQLILYLKTSF